MNSETKMQLENVRVGDLIPTKFGIELLADNIAEQVIAGELEPLAVAVKMNALEQLSKAIRERIQDSVMDQLGKYPKGKAEVLGADVSMVDTVKYDYSHIAEWSELDQQIQELTEKRKEIEDHQKKFFRGELPVKSSTTVFKIILKK